MFLMIWLTAALSQAAPPSSDPAALFAKGLTFDQFLAEAQSQKDTWQTNAGRNTLKPEMTERLRKAGADLQILVIAEAACSDSVNVLPYLARLASSAAVELRIVNKATGQAVAEAHRTPDGRAATPTVILLRKGVEAGAWVERPAVLQTWYLSMEGKLPREERLARKLAWYDWDRGDTSLAEILALVEKTSTHVSAR
jgi:Thioredoxin